MLPRARLCRADKVRYIGNGITLERFKGTSSAVCRWRRRPWVGRSVTMCGACVM